jgi:hypothetical protein
LNDPAEVRTQGNAPERRKHALMFALDTYREVLVLFKKRDHRKMKLKGLKWKKLR